MKKIIIVSAIACLLMAFTLHRETPVYTSQDPLKESMGRGAVVYTDYCIQCHMGKGEGVPKAFPPLAKSDWLFKNNITNAIRVVKYGQTGEITVNGETYNGVMANLGLYEDEVADVMNYILNSWGNSHGEIITEAQVKAVAKE
ncbi:cytochrome c [Dokdonia sp.]|uniref:c-type cytochrome n=1 Tax=Dokdonia sp. TaxID=2024995 RepID=UPI0032674F8B